MHWCHRRLGWLAFLLAFAWSSVASAISGAEIIARAESWVAAGMPYCQCANHAWDSHGQCNRPDNPDWDPYRSDCSGFVSFAWGLPAPGLICDHPYSISLWTVSTTIDAMALQPGDALNSTEHVMLFKGWVVPGSVATLIDEHDWGTNATEQDFAVSVNGSTVTRLDWPSNPFTAIRYNGVQSCEAHCEGSVIVGTDCGKGDCAAYGSSCVSDALGVRCVSVFCPPVGHQVVCIDATKTLECQDGQPVSSGDCAPYAGMCTMTLGTDATCVSDFCVSDPEQPPVAHDVCLPNGQLGHCGANGLPQGEDCPSGAPCTETASGAHCAVEEGSDGGVHADAGAPSNEAPTDAESGAVSDDSGGCTIASTGRSQAPLGWPLAALAALALRRPARGRRRAFGTRAVRRFRLVSEAPPRGRRSARPGSGSA
jgi:hypothetical protein